MGLPDAAVQEARERVRVAISNSGFTFPMKKVIVNLAPANLRKEGPAFDLPIALAVLAASGVILEEGLEGVGVVGELSLDGGLRGVRGALSVAEGAKREGLEALVMPWHNAPEAASIGDPRLYGIRSLAEAVDFIAGEQEVDPSMSVEGDQENTQEPVDDFADVAGQRYAKRALEVNAVGGHNIFINFSNTTRPRTSPLCHDGPRAKGRVGARVAVGRS